MANIYLSSTLLWNGSMEEIFDMVFQSGLDGIELWSQQFFYRKFDIDEFEKLALAMYEELDVQEMDEQIERAREVQQRKSEKDMLQQIMEQDFSDEQMEVILEALNEKLPLKEIMKFALPEKSPTQMKFIKKLVQE